MNAFVNNDVGENIPVYMGSYGIGVSRLVAAIIEAYHDDKEYYGQFQLLHFKLV